MGSETIGHKWAGKVANIQMAWAAAHRPHVDVEAEVVERHQSNMSTPDAPIDVCQLEAHHVNQKTAASTCVRESLSHSPSTCSRPSLKGETAR